MRSILKILNFNHVKKGTLFLAILTLITIIFPYIKLNKKFITFVFVCSYSGLLIQKILSYNKLQNLKKNCVYSETLVEVEDPTDLKVPKVAKTRFGGGRGVKPKMKSVGRN